MELTKYTTAATSDKSALTRYVKGLREAGWVAVKVYDGSNIKLSGNERVNEVVEHLTATDASTLYLQKGEHKAAMFFVLGNCPYEVCNNTSYYDEWNADLDAVEEAINLEGL